MDEVVQDRKGAAIPRKDGVDNSHLASRIEYPVTLLRGRPGRAIGRDGAVVQGHHAYAVIDTSALGRANCSGARSANRSVTADGAAFQRYRAKVIRNAAACARAPRAAAPSAAFRHIAAHCAPLYR